MLKSRLRHHLVLELSVSANEEDGSAANSCESDSSSSSSSSSSETSSEHDSNINWSNALSSPSIDSQMEEEMSQLKDKKSNNKKTKSPLLLDENSFALLRLQHELKAFHFNTQLYKFREHLAEYARLYRQNYPYLMSAKTKYYISTEEKGVGSLDLLFGSFCQFMGMQKIKHLPNESGERVFCWLGKHRANEILPTLRPNHHFVNRLPLDIYLKDKQSLAFALKGSMFQKNLHYPAHNCPHQKGKRLLLQLLCPHQYEQHSFEPCEEPGCYEHMWREAALEHGVVGVHCGKLCPCFTTRCFVPETRVFVNSLQQNVFICETAKSAPNSQWIVKPSYLRSGRGIQVLPSVHHLREFLKVHTCQRFMWGQDYVIQRYIKNPMLTNNGQKFDIRMFLLVIVCRFWRVLGFLHPGYVRKVYKPYQPMTKDDKFDPATHLANTRVWKKALADKLAQPIPENPVTTSETSTKSSVQSCPRHKSRRKQEREATATNRRREKEIEKNDEAAVALSALDQLMNSAVPSRRRGKGQKLKKENDVYAPPPPPPYEPVPLTGFFQKSFATDECEEYNYAVRHGCLSQNDKSLPLITGANRIPGARHLGSESTSSKTTKPATKLPNKPPEGANAGPKNPLDQFTTNKEFIVCLRNIVSRICKSVFCQVKKRSNCYQLFSLDICIDENGKPWLLEANPTIITEDVNWSSSTIRNVVPAVYIESLSLAFECTKKSLNFLALRTPSTHPRKPDDLIFRENFLWMYSTPRSKCDMFEMKNLKYSIDNRFKTQITSAGMMYQPVDYYPERNRKRSSKSARQAAGNAAAPSSQPRSHYRCPTPVSSVPVLEEDIAFSTRYLRLQLDSIDRQRSVRRLQRCTQMQTEHNQQSRYDTFRENQRRLTFEKRLERVILD